MMMIQTERVCFPVRCFIATGHQMMKCYINRSLTGGRWMICCFCLVSIVAVEVVRVGIRGAPEAHSWVLIVVACCSCYRGRSCDIFIFLHSGRGLLLHLFCTNFRRLVCSFWVLGAVGHHSCVINIPNLVITWSSLVCHFSFNRYIYISSFLILLDWLRLLIDSRTQTHSHTPS